MPMGTKPHANFMKSKHWDLSKVPVSCLKEAPVSSNGISILSKYTLRQAKADVHVANLLHTKSLDLVYLQDHQLNLKKNKGL